MPKVRQTKAWRESDALAEVIAVDPRDFVLETAPPDYVEKISQLLGSSSAGQTGRDGAADTDSDSADSLFITQKPVPEVVRSGRRQRHGVRSGPMSPSFQEESEDDSSSSASPQESRSKKKRKKVKFRLPKYSFPFLKDKTLKLTSPVLPGPQNIRLHYSAIGGFFECMRKLQQSCQTGEDLESNLPTIDMNGECIIPISEGEETFEEADMKVVAKKCFVVPSKVKQSEPWYSETRDGEVKQQRMSCVNAEATMSRGWRKTDKTPTKKPSMRTALPSNLETSDDEASSYRILEEGGVSDKQQTGDRGVPALTETPKTNRRVNREKRDNSEQKEKEHELCDDSSAPLCEQSPKERTQEGREASISEPQAEVLNKEGLSESKGQSFFQGRANSITICSETSGKKKKHDKEDDESAEEDDSQSQVEPEVQHATPSMNEEITEVEETPHLPQTINEPELHDKHVMEDSDISDSHQKKKKKKKKKKHNMSPAEDVRQELHEHFESDVRIGEDSVHLDRGERTMKEDKEDDESAKEDDSQSQEEPEVQHATPSMNEEITEVVEMPHLPQTINEPELHDKHVMEDGDISDSHQKKKKKKKKKNNMSQSQEVEVQHAAAYVNEGIAEMEETPRLSQVSELDPNGKTGIEENDISDSQQKKKKKKKRQNESPAEADRQEVHEHFESDVRLREDPVHPDTGKEEKKKKKKKNDKENNESVEEEKSQEELEVQRAAAYGNEGITEGEEPSRLSQPTEPEFSEKQMMEESHIPNLHQKKKKKRKNESPVENEKTEKKKKKKTESSNDEEDAEQLKRVTAPESLHEDVEMLMEKIAAAQYDVSESVAAGKPGVSAGGESAEITGSLEESNERVKKKKKKRREKTAEQENVEKDQELDFEEPKGACEEAPSDRGGRKKKKHKRKETGSESAADAGCSDEAAVVKKRWKKSVEEAPAVGSEDQDRSHFEPPSSHSVMKKKQRNIKRRLHNPSEDWLTDY